tara:strand:+ start:1082 stop:1459 length:378 start_codon:yes stop_codon:yes gene_type:complete
MTIHEFTTTDPKRAVNARRTTEGEIKMSLPSASQRALKQYVEQIEKIESEKAELADMLKEKFSEARGAGFDVKIMRQVLKLRKQTQDERDEQSDLLDTYLHAMGMAGTPLGDYADAQDAERLALQ